MSKIARQVSLAVLTMGLTFTAAQAQQAQADTRSAQASLVKQVKEHIDKAKAAQALGIDPKQADQMIRGTVSLPSGTGKDVLARTLHAEKLRFLSPTGEAVEVVAPLPKDLRAALNMLRKYGR